MEVNSSFLVMFFILYLISLSYAMLPLLRKEEKAEKKDLYILETENEQAGVLLIVYVILLSFVATFTGIGIYSIEINANSIHEFSSFYKFAVCILNVLMVTEILLSRRNPHKSFFVPHSSQEVYR